MNEKELIEKLKTLQAIEPGPEFAESLKLTILQTPKRRMGGFGMPVNILYQSLNFGLAMTLTAVFILIVISGITGSLRNQILTRALGVEILNQNTALSQHIDQQLSDAQYLNTVAEKTNLALKEASTKGLGHINPLILEKEAGNLNFKDPVNTNIDVLLDKAL